jgi:hypothetical protein
MCVWNNIVSDKCYEKNQYCVMRIGKYFFQIQIRGAVILAYGSGSRAN